LSGNDAILAQCAGAIVLGTIIINVTDPLLPMDWSQLAAGQGEFYIKVSTSDNVLELPTTVVMHARGMRPGGFR
jgi:hypothetical protein